MDQIGRKGVRGQGGSMTILCEIVMDELEMDGEKMDKAAAWLTSPFRELVVDDE